MKCGPGLVAAVGSVLLFSTGVQAEEKTRHFPAANCRYTLPSDEWGWADVSGAGITFTAVGPDGTRVALSILEKPPSARLDQRFADMFDRGFVIPGRLEKRGGRFTTFLGLPCYQIEARMVEEDRTTTSRVFLAHDLGYHLLVIGGKEPVERNPDLEAILGGFAFDVPPTTPPPAPVSGETKDLSYRMGQVAVYCLFGAGVLIAWRAVFRRRPVSPTGAR